MILDRGNSVGESWQARYDRLHLHTPRVQSALPGLRAHTPVIPAFPGMAGFPGPVVHASAYRDAGPYRGLAVLVVGAGNSGAEIAADLAEQGAASVHLAIRTPPNLIPRQVGPIPTTLLAIPMDVLPSRLVDPLNRALQRAILGDLTRFGMPAPRAGVVAQARATGVTPTIDVGLVAALRAGSVCPVPALDHFDGAYAVLVDGTRSAPDAVVVASGYSSGLEGLFDDPDVLDGRGIPLVSGRRTLPSAPGLRFIGLFNPLKGQLLQIGLDARSVARVVARELARR